MELSKLPSKSKTFWVNFFVFVIALLSLSQDHEFVQNYPDVVKWIVATIASINIGLRFVTRVPISWRM